MNKSAFLCVLMVLCLPVFALDTKALLGTFLNLSQNDFELDSKSKNATEKKAYGDYQAADLDGGSPDGKITYLEYLTHINTKTPGAVSPFDFALTRILPNLKDFSYADNGDFFASGISTQAITLNPGQTIPGGTKLSFFRWGGIRLSPAQDFMSGGMSVRGGKDLVVDIYLDWEKNIFHFGSFQVLKDLQVGNVSCKAISVDPWDINIELQKNGIARRAVLAEPFGDKGSVFNIDERVQFDWTGKSVEAAVLLQNRQIQGRQVVAYDHGQLERSKGGLWGGNRPNIYFSQGKITMCYEDNKSLAGTLIPGINQYHYDAWGRVTGISPENSLFLGYPVAINKFQGGWDWAMPKPTVAVSYGKSGLVAAFKIENGIVLSGKAGEQVLPSGTGLTIDIKTGNCLSARFPDGKVIAFNSLRDQMAPQKVPATEQPAQVRLWMDLWLTANPEAADGSNKDLRQGHIQVRDRMLALQKKAEHENLLMKLLDVVLLYKDKSKGLSAGNIALDLDGDGKIQKKELFPDSSILSADGSVSLDSLFGYAVKTAQNLPPAKLKALGHILSSIAISSATEDMGQIDILGSALSKMGVHPFKDKKIFYFPNGSGDKVFCRNIEFYKSNMPKKIKLESHKKDGPPLRVSIPSQEEKLEIWLYDDGRLEKENPGNKHTNGYWHDANEVEFWESGSLSRIGNFPYAVIMLPAEYGGVNNPAKTHNILWNKDDTVYQLVQAGDGNNGDGNIYILSDNMRIGYFYSITWRNIPQCRVEIGLENAIAVDLFFKKGQYTLYNEDPATKQLTSYIKTFDADTTIKVIGGFWVDSKGEITRYWGEYKK